jgi:Tetracyclin repressor-like, C-terminal domain
LPPFCVRAYLEEHRDELSIADRNLAAFVCVTTVEALTHAAVVHRPEVLGDEKAETFVDEISRLVLRYLEAQQIIEKAQRYD